MSKNDSLTFCSRCGSDACYVQEVNDKIKIYMCYGCGFTTNSLMKVGEPFFEEQMETLPNLYKALMVEDENGLVWMPSTVNIHDKGMVFANGKNKDDWSWGAVKAISVKEEEKEKFPIPNKPGEFYKWRMDMKNVKSYKEKDYMDALSHIGALPSNEK
tara:strand:+ start:1243 stop:1716 length:474 start_codon:yes stop_codon:yes gene_type:complete